MGEDRKGTAGVAWQGMATHGGVAQVGIGLERFGVAGAGNKTTLKGNNMNHRELHTELQNLALANGGLLHPQAVVAAASNTDSPLHAYFEWDDTQAARQFREEQARGLIRSVKIEMQASEPVIIRAFVSLPADRETGAGYRQIQDVIGNDFLRRQLADDINQKIAEWKRKAQIYGLVCDFAPMQAFAEEIAA